MFSVTSLLQVVSSQNETSSVAIVPGSSSPFNGQFYVPNAVTVSPNTSVSWTNQDTQLTYDYFR